MLTNVEVFTVFWGKAWQDAANAALANQLNDFFDFILASKLIDQLSEYSVPGKTIGHGKRTGSLTLTTSEPGVAIQDSDVQQALAREIGSGTLPPANANSLYFLYLPPGTQVEQGGSASCTDFCGYHDATGDNIFYAVMPYPGCTGCQGGLTTLDALTSTSSHELCEAVTIQSPGKAGTTTQTEKLPTSAPGRPKSSVSTLCSSSGRIPPRPASSRPPSPHIFYSEAHAPSVALGLRSSAPMASPATADCAVRAACARIPARQPSRRTRPDETP
ncbi:MAG TPA: hypothetical protein VLC94_05820 [Candidatus Acidoferrum sp.]|nr:hypothetical protein [Candidatus Acidoferrum sp.]